jgi:hypothetical protein
MIAKAIDKILDIARPIAIAVAGEQYSTVPLTRIQKDLRAEPLEAATLTGLIMYIKNFKENLKDTPLLVHVVSPTRVELTTALDRDRKRETLMIVHAETPRIPFGSYIGNEKMLITVQSMFIDDPETDRAAVLKFAGTVTSGSIKEYGDDGVTQKATIKQGVASKAEGIVPSPCVLRPFRTFAEVEQPASKFIFRMRDTRDEVEAALFEADGGAWKNEARENIRKYLEKQVGVLVTVIS